MTTPIPIIALAAITGASLFILFFAYICQAEKIESLTEVQVFIRSHDTSDGLLDEYQISSDGPILMDICFSPLPTGASATDTAGAQVKDDNDQPLFNLVLTQRETQCVVLGGDSVGSTYEIETWGLENSGPLMRTVITTQTTPSNPAELVEIP